MEDKAMRTLLIGLVAATALALSAAAFGGVGGPAFYVNGSTYRTVGTPTDLSGTGAPAQAWDTIYDFGGHQLNVATAAPGDPGYNGGRWMVHGLAFADDAQYAALAAQYGGANGVFDTNAEVAALLAAQPSLDVGVVKQFECPVIPMPGRG
jgi:hypothetical protein